MSISITIGIIVTFIIISTSISNQPKVKGKDIKMVIISSNKEKCGEYQRLAVQRSYGNGKDRKFAIVGYVGTSADALAYYPTKDGAITAMNKIFAAYENGKKTYTL